MDQFYLTPFSLSVLNVAIMISVLCVFLLRLKDKQPATRNLVTFLLGADLVFVLFFYVFSSLNLMSVNVSWLLLHTIVFFVLFLIRFAYHYPVTRFPDELHRSFKLFLVLALLVYGFYLYHVSIIEAVFEPNAGFFIYPGTHEIGVLIGLQFLWAFFVLSRQIKQLKLQAETSGNPADQLNAVRHISAIRQMTLILVFPLLLIGVVTLAYLELASWELVSYLLGTGFMVFVLLFTVVYLNHAAEPSTLLVKMIGMTLGLVLVFIGFSSAITLQQQQSSYLAVKQIEVDNNVARVHAGDLMRLPGGLSYVARAGSLLMADAMPVDSFQRKPSAWQSGWGFRQVEANKAEKFFITFTTEMAGVEYEFGYPYQDFREFMHEKTLPQLLLMMTATLLVLILFPLLFRLSLFAPLERLLTGVDAIERGQLDIDIPVTVNDEVGGLTRSFNAMVRSVADARDKLRSAYDYQLDLTEGYSRFVPKEILTTLDKDNIIELGLGDNVRREMTVLFSDIRSFTNISELMTPEEIFDFINAYLKDIGPIVRRHGGYIDKYIGDAVMALFPESPDDGIRASVEMQAQARIFNESHPSIGGSVTLSIGVGLHTGELMLGTIGEPQRMEGTVISDAVNLASRIEGLTKLYAAPILISSDTYDRLERPGDFNTRRLDRVRVKGKQQWVEIVEVLDGYEAEELHMKLSTRGAFNDAVGIFQEEKFSEALRHFEAIAREYPGDKAVDVYIERCNNFIEFGTPDGWDGAVKL